MSNFTDDFAKDHHAWICSQTGMPRYLNMGYFSGFDALQSELRRFWWYIFQSLNLSYMLEITRGFNFIYYF